MFHLTDGAPRYLDKRLSQFLSNRLVTCCLMQQFKSPFINQFRDALAALHYEHFGFFWFEACFSGVLLYQSFICQTAHPVILIATFSIPFQSIGCLLFDAAIRVPIHQTVQGCLGSTVLSALWILPIWTILFQRSSVLFFHPLHGTYHCLKFGNTKAVLF